MALRYSFLLFLLPLISWGQDTRQSEFLVYHNMLMKPDTMVFSFWKNQDTLIVKRIMQQYVPTAEEEAHRTSYRNTSSSNAVKGSKLFNGKNITYFFGEEKHLISNDTLYKFVTTNKLSADSIDVLFGRKDNTSSYRKKNYKRNLKIIEENRQLTKKPVYYPGIFSQHKAIEIENHTDCPDKIELINQWTGDNKTYRKVRLTYGCNNYRKSITLLFDDGYNLYGFDEKYIDKSMNRFLQKKPFKAKYHLKNSLP
ncbi:MAG: hypothetical protein ACQESX_09130 [Bacteroidota bacterium]